MNDRPPTGYLVFRWLLVGGFAIALLLTGYSTLDEFFSVLIEP